jgi:alpha-ketoglutarate-dependent taurine dioxygenase
MASSFTIEPLAHPEGKTCKVRVINLHNTTDLQNPCLPYFA